MGWLLPGGARPANKGRGARAGKHSREAGGPVVSQDLGGQEEQQLGGVIGGEGQAVEIR